jgi:hypothetical protein
MVAYYPTVVLCYQSVPTVLTDAFTPFAVRNGINVNNFVCIFMEGILKKHLFL